MGVHRNSWRNPDSPGCRTPLRSQVPVTVTNSLLTVHGTSSDASGTVANVFVEVTPMVFGLRPRRPMGCSRIGRPKSNLRPAKNNIKAYAVNSAAQVSHTNSVNVTYEPVAQLYVNVNGPERSVQITMARTWYSASTTRSRLWPIRAVSLPIGFNPRSVQFHAPSLQFTMSNNLVLTASS